MHDHPTTRDEFRCWRCNRFLAMLVGFQGQVERRCKSCRAFSVWTGDSGIDRSTSERHTAADQGWRLRARTAAKCEPCDTILALVDATAGRIELGCKRCKRVTTVRPSVARSSLTAEEMMAMVEERWEAFVREKVRRRAEMAVGLRFDTFKRDGFRCRYCGRSASDGVLLHADHVIPESKGGPTTLENLVTACIDCNLGKSDKDIDTAIVLRS